MLTTRVIVVGRPATPGERIKKLRIEMCLTLRQLEAATGISNGFLSQVERGRQDMSLSRAVLLAKFLGVSVDYIATGRHAPRDRAP